MGWIAALLLCSQLALAAQPWPMTGKVIHVEDGDTLTILQSDFSKVSVRLSDIDAPRNLAWTRQARTTV